MTQSPKARGRSAYEEDVRRHPTYTDGRARKAWHELGEVEQWAWVRNPTPRRELGDHLRDGGSLRRKEADMIHRICLVTGEECFTCYIGQLCQKAPRPKKPRLNVKLEG